MNKLKKIIEFAVEREWNELDRYADKIPFGGVKKGKYQGKYLKYKYVKEVKHKYEEAYDVVFKSKDGDKISFHFHPHQFLFSHDFAKAVFGEVVIWVCAIDGLLNNKEVTYGQTCGICEGIVISQPDFEYHLQQAVISKDPIDYYYKYISDKGKNK